MPVLLLSTVRDTEIHKPVAALRLLVILLEEKTCTCKMSHKKKVMLDADSQKVVPTVIVQTPKSVHLACVLELVTQEMITSNPQLDGFPFHCFSLSLGFFPRATSCKCAFLCVYGAIVYLSVSLSPVK